MLAGMGVAGVACVVLALAPDPACCRRWQASPRACLRTGPAVRGAVTIELAGVAGSLSPLLLATAVAGAIAVVVAALRLVTAAGLAQCRRTEPAGRAAARLWDCGAGPLSARMEYTATSFAEPLQRVFDDVLQPEQDVDVTHHGESRYLVQAVEYRRRVPDRIERRLYEPVLAAAAAWGRAGRRLATGSVHRYLGYGFYTRVRAADPAGGDPVSALGRRRAASCRRW